MRLRPVGRERSWGSSRGEAAPRPYGPQFPWDGLGANRVKMTRVNSQFKTHHFLPPGFPAQPQSRHPSPPLTMVAYVLSFVKRKEVRAVGRFAVAGLCERGDSLRIPVRWSEPAACPIPPRRAVGAALVAPQGAHERRPHKRTRRGL